VQEPPPYKPSNNLLGSVSFSRVTPLFQTSLCPHQPRAKTRTAPSFAAQLAEITTVAVGFPKLNKPGRMLPLRLSRVNHAATKLPTHACAHSQEHQQHGQAGHSTTLPTLHHHCQQRQRTPHLHCCPHPHVHRLQCCYSCCLGHRLLITCPLAVHCLLTSESLRDKCCCPGGLPLLQCRQKPCCHRPHCCCTVHARY